MATPYLQRRLIRRPQYAEEFSYPIQAVEGDNMPPLQVSSLLCQNGLQ